MCSSRQYSYPSHVQKEFVSFLHCIKRSPSIKQSVFKVPKITSLDVLYFRPPLSSRGHHLRSPKGTFSIVLTCI